MKSFYSAEHGTDTPCVVALGCFDGTHVGHMALINETKRIASSLSLRSAVWSFSAPPKKFFLNEDIPLLTTPKEKEALMALCGIDLFWSVDFDEKIAALSPEDFFESILIGRLCARHILCGFNYRFGKGGRGNTDMLKALCAAHGIGLSVLPPVTVGELTVSSSAIRACIANGEIEKASLLLGRNYSLTEEVVSGQRLGRQLGFPTINQSFKDGKCVPAHGVYVSAITVEGERRYGITNIGVRPTVDGHTLCAETNIFDFSGDLYGKAVKVEFLTFLRKEKKFSSVDELRAQVLWDIERAKSYLKSI